MVKVWEQQYPGGDVTYIDEFGVTHVEGAQHRQTMPDAYPLPSTAPAAVTRKTPRGRKVPQQGRGSIKQGPWRECFKKCTIRWSALPDECPWNVQCPPTSSRKNVWDAKQAQGVMCAYYDLYIACCMSSCEQITIMGPKGKPITRGTIPEADNCFPCDNPSTGKVLSIAYWSQQMNVGGYQSLAAYDSVAGYSIPFCADEKLVWSIVSGGGSLTSATGLSTEYHAPDANENCVQNPLIKLTDCCGRTATLKIAVNVYPGNPTAASQYALKYFPDPNYPYENLESTCAIVWRCDGSLNSLPWEDVFCQPIEVGYLIVGWGDQCNKYGGCVVIDNRTPEMKAAGCCPYQLL